MVAELGLEPRLSESESLVLPITPFGINECENLAINPDVIKKVSKKNVFRNTKKNHSSVGSRF